MPLHVLYDSFEDCFPLKLGDLSESNIIRYVVFHYPGVSSSRLASSVETLNLTRNQIIKCFSMLPKS